MKKILILEDAKIGGQLLQAIGERGLQGSWFVGVKSIGNGSLTGFRSDLSEETVQLEDYGMAFVDGFLYISGLMGWVVLPELKQQMFTIGTSSLGEIGAHTSIEKADMVTLFDQLLEQAGGGCK